MPALVARRLTANWFSKKLQISDVNGGELILPAFNKYETVPLEIIIVEPTQNSRGIDRFSRIDISPISLEVALNDTYDDATPLAFQNTWTKDEEDNVFSGELALNTAALNTWLNSDSKQAYLEITITEGTARTVVYLGQVTVKNSVLQVGATVPTPVEEYYTKAQADSQFVKKIEQGQITLQVGSYQRILGVTSDGVPIDQILPV